MPHNALWFPLPVNNKPKVQFKLILQQFEVFAEQERHVLKAQQQYAEYPYCIAHLTAKSSFPPAHAQYHSNAVLLCVFSSVAEQKTTVSILDDIGSMFDDLADQLDAMLE